MKNGIISHSDINREPPRIMFLDLNSAFASAEQQAWPGLRGRPMGVTNRFSKECCVIAASYEAKALGIRVGVRRTEAMALYPGFVMLETDPTKYTHMYLNLLRIMKSYSPDIHMKSIDEGIIDFTHIAGITTDRMIEIGYEIKQRLANDVGKWMRINVGIAPNRFLAKQAAGWHKPDGLDVIDHRNLLSYYKEKSELEDLNGIADGYGSRLKAHNIFTTTQFLNADADLLRRRVFKSIHGYHWHEKLRGYEADDYETKLGMVGRQWVLSKRTNNDAWLRSCLHYLVQTTGMKLRFRNVEARGVCVWVGFSMGGGWTDKNKYRSSFFTDNDIWEHVSRLFDQRPKHMVISSMGLYLYSLEQSSRSQLGMFEDVGKRDNIQIAMDEINDFWGNFTIFTSDTLTGVHTVKQKIPFGGTQYFKLLLKRA